MAQDSIQLRALFFGAARDATGSEEITLRLPTGASVADALHSVREDYPELARFGRTLLIALNEAHAQDDGQILQDGDELAFFPPVSGGSHQQQIADEAASDNSLNQSPDFYELTRAPVSVEQVARRVVLPVCGATVTLDGYVREYTKEKRTAYLIYEGYETMALKEMRRIGDQARAQFEIASVGIVHRLGKLEIGETSVCISVGAPHRRPAFQACEWLIKELKRVVPIWKKEIYTDGTTEWSEGERTHA